MMDSRIFEYDEIISVERKKTSCNVYNLEIEEKHTYTANGFVVHNCVTEMSNALNLGAADAIVSRNANKPMDNIYIYKLAHLDGSLCQYCRKFYLEPDGITPKVYTMSELIANGSNYGKKASEWKPVIGATHPQERCELVELPNGWGFEEGSNQASFMDKDYVWYNRKK